MELFAEDELEVDRLFAAASSQYQSKASRRRGSLTAGPLDASHTASVRVWLEL